MIGYDFSDVFAVNVGFYIVGKVNIQYIDTDL